MSRAEIDDQLMMARAWERTCWRELDAACSSDRAVDVTEICAEIMDTWKRIKALVVVTSEQASGDLLWTGTKTS